VTFGIGLSRNEGLYMATKLSVLVLDSDQEALQNWQTVISQLGYDAALAQDINHAVDLIATIAVDIGVLNVPEENGDAVFKAAGLLRNRKIPFFFTSAKTRTIPRAHGFKELTLLKPLDRPVVEKLVNYLTTWQPNT
jgi:DNA-binding response OmpR family regulator